MANVDVPKAVDEAVNDDNKIVTVTSHEGTVIKIEQKILMMFGMVKEMIQNGVGDGDDDTSYPLPNVRQEILEKIIEWCDWHKNDVPLPKDDGSDDEEDVRGIDDIPQWDVKFFAKMTESDRLEMFTAANYLDIEYLLELLSKTVAQSMRGKSMDELAALFKDPNVPEGQDGRNGKSA